MIRVGFLVAACAACGSSGDVAPDVFVDYPGAPNGIIPYRAGGTFQVSVSVPDADLRNATHATVSIVTSEQVTGATTTTTFALTDQGDRTVGGTGTLVWPPGGSTDATKPLTIDTQAAGTERADRLPLEILTLTAGEPMLSNSGSQTTASLCIDSTSSDGTLTVRVAGGVLKDNNATDATVPLLLDPCNGGADPTRSHAKLSILAMSPTVDVVATLPNTGISAERVIILDSADPVDLDPTWPSMAPGLSIVQIAVHASRGGLPVKNVALTLDSTPVLVFVPASPSTDDNGDAQIAFQMPETGDVYVRIRAGSTTAAKTILGTPPPPR